MRYRKSGLSVFTTMLFIVQTTLIGNEVLPSCHSALQIQISDNSLQSSNQGILISLKKQRTNNRSIRFGLSLDGSIDLKNTENRTIGDTKYTLYDYNIALFTQYLFHKSVLNNLRPYFGIGPYLSTGNYYIREENEVYGGTQIKKEIIPQITVGLLSTIGIEVFQYKNLSFEVEYRLLADYMHRKTTNKTLAKQGSADQYSVTAKEITTDDIYTLEPPSVSIGICYYYK